MKDIIDWLNSALATKDIGAGMMHYRVKGGTISATNGQITASHPWAFSKDEFLVPGMLFEKVLDRMTDTPDISLNKDGALVMKSGRFKGIVQTLPLTEWDYPGVEEVKWSPLPKGLPDILKELRVFVSDNSSDQRATCIALQNGWAFATNDIAIAGAQCKGLEKINALLPAWAIDFILNHSDELKEWSWNENFVAFRWSNKAWMRSQLIIGQFPEKAASMVQASVKVRTTQKIDDAFRKAISRVGELAEDSILIYANKIEAGIGKGTVEDASIKCETPKDAKCSIFGSKILLPVIALADSWSPSLWPAPIPFRGKLISGYVMGRRA